MVLDEQPAAVEEEESDDEAIDMEVSTTFIFVKNDVFLFLLLSFTLKNSSLQDFVESGKLEEDTGVVEPTVEVFLINILEKQLFWLYFFLLLFINQLHRPPRVARFCQHAHMTSTLPTTNIIRCSIQ